eukprot:332655_1
MSLDGNDQNRRRNEYHTRKQEGRFTIVNINTKHKNQICFGYGYKLILLFTLFVSLSVVYPIFTIILNDPESMFKIILNHLTTRDIPNIIIHTTWKKNAFIHNMSHDEYCTFIHRSLLYVPTCSWANDTPHTFPLLITGTPRSGTVYIWKLLNSIGINVVDDWYPPISGVHQGQISWINAVWEKNEQTHIGTSRLHNARFNNVFHLIRDPLHSITSICTEPIVSKGWPPEKIRILSGMCKKNYKFINRHINNAMDQKKQTQVEVIMQFYYHWHMLLNNFGFEIFKVENLFSSNDEIVVDTLNWIIKTSGLENRVNNTNLLNGKMDNKLFNVTHTKIHSRKHRTHFTWDELFLLNEELSMKIYNMAKEWGYKYNWDYAVFNNITKYNHSFRSNPRQLITCEPDFDGF